MSNVMDLSEAIAEAYASAPYDDHIIYTLQLDHPAFDTPIRIAQVPNIGAGGINETLTLLLETGDMADFVGSAFKVTLPETGSKQAGSFTFTFFGVAPHIETYLEQAALSGGKIKATYREYLASVAKTVGPELVWPNIDISSPSVQGFDVVCQGAIFGWLNKPFGGLYTPGDYPSLVRGR